MSTKQRFFKQFYRGESLDRPRRPSVFPTVYSPFPTPVDYSFESISFQGLVGWSLTSFFSTNTDISKTTFFQCGSRRSSGWENSHLHEKGKAVPYSLEEFRRSAHLPLVSRERRWINHLSLWRMASATKTYGYLSSRRASSPFDQYQFILLGDGCEQLA